MNSKNTESVVEHQIDQYLFGGRSLLHRVKRPSKICHVKKLGDSRNYMSPILVPSSAKRITTQILEIARLNGRIYFIFRVFVYDIICPSKELLVRS